MNFNETLEPQTAAKRNFGQPPVAVSQNPTAPPISYNTLFHDLIKGAGNVINSVTVPVGNQWASATAKAALTAADNTGPAVGSETPIGGRIYRNSVF